MLNQKIVFIPVGDPPTMNNIIANFMIMFTILLVSCAILYFASKPGRRTINSIVFGVFVALVLYSVSQTKYIKDIEIDPVSSRLTYDFITITGREGKITIDLLAAEYSYRRQVTRGYSGYVLILKDKDSDLKIMETRRSENKRDKNSLLRRDMDRMDGIIRQIKNVHNKAPAA